MMPSLPCPTARSSIGWYASHLDLIEAVALHLAEAMEAQKCAYEALDSSAMPVRDAKRRGSGWLAGEADIGWSNSLGWYEGFCLLISVNPEGVIHRLRLRPSFHQRPTPGRDFLRAALGSQSKAQERGIGGCGAVRSR